MSLEDSLSDCFSYIYNEGPIDRLNKWNGDSTLFKVINKYVPTIISQVFDSKGVSGIKVIGRSGSSGVWSATPYVCILDDFNRSGSLYSPSKGIYPCFLLPKDSSSFYLTYMLAVGSKKPRELNALKLSFLEGLDIPYRTDSENIMIDPDPHFYKDAVVFFKEYISSSTLNDQEIISDILDFYNYHVATKAHYVDVFNRVILKK